MLVHALPRQLRAYGMDVLVNDPPLQSRGTLNRPHTDLTELLQQSDIVTLHVPLTLGGDHPTHHLLNTSAMSHLRPGTLLINTSRGGVLEESAVPMSIDLVLDVFEGEPHLRQASVERALLATPHIAGYTVDAKERGADMIEHALRAFLQGAEEITSVDEKNVTIDPRRLDSDLKEVWLADPTPTTFDRCRKAYILI